MKTQLLLPVSLVALSLVSAFGQPQPLLPPQPQPFLPPQPATIPVRSFNLPGQSQPETSKLTTFSLDFPGGTPQQLVTAIEKAMAKPLNVIIPAEHADFKLPPLKMNNVDVWQLFQALELTSQKTETSFAGPNFPGQIYQQFHSSYGFRTQGARSDDSIWYFAVDKPVLPPPIEPATVCRFYPLATYLERGLTEDDITTAIQTGWKMLGEENPAAINFHKDTKLLIAVGETGWLETIDAVLKALSPTPEELANDQVKNFMQRQGRRPAADGSLPPPAKPAEQPKPGN